MTRTELNLRLPNSPGALGAIARLLANEHVNVLALSLDATGQLRLVVDNHGRAATALAAAHHRVSEREVLVVDLPPVHGALVPILNLLADAGVNVEYAYAGGGQGLAAVAVLGVENAMRAAAVAGL